MTIYDISLPLQKGIPYWPGDEAPKIEQYLSIANGDIVNGTWLNSSAHIATHLDAPKHLYDDGKTIEQLSLEILTGPVAVINIAETDRIDRNVLKGLNWPGVPRILFKTRNSELWREPTHEFQSNYVSLTADGAEFLLEKEVNLVGIDYLSVDLYSNKDLPVHKLLLKNEVIVIENVNLLEVPPGIYELYCLPLRIVGSDGAPARAILKSID